MFKSEARSVFRSWLSFALLVALLWVIAPLGFVYAVALSRPFWWFSCGAFVASSFLWLLHR